MDVENKYGTLAIQQELLTLLKEFHACCVANNVKYSLAYGSLLGAIRHKGFIPWDDDVDVIVTRNEFKKLQKVMQNTSTFHWDYMTKTALWVGRVRMKNRKLTTTEIPPTIDVFIFDNVPDNAFLAKLKLLSILFAMGMVKGKPDLSRFKFVMKVAALLSWLFGRLLPSNIKYSLIEFLSECCNLTESRNISCYNTVFLYMGKIFSKSMMSGYDNIQFEDTTLSIMKGYDEFLTTTYGDYMTPPKEKVGHHLHPEFGPKYK